MDGHFGSLVRAITFQQLSGRSAAAIHGRVRATVDGALTPAALAAVPDEQLRAAGLSANKLASLRDLTAKVLDGTVVFDGRPVSATTRSSSGSSPCGASGAGPPRCT